MKKALFLLISCAYLFAGCKKQENHIDHPADESDITGIATIAGIILDENNNPVANATISTHEKQTTSNTNGIFLLKNANVSLERCVLKISKEGFVNHTYILSPSAQSVNYVKAFLSNDAPTHTIAATNGGSISLPDGSAVEFPANAFISGNGNAYSGTVSIGFKHLSIDDPNFSFKIPGNDLLGKNISGEKKPLSTYGMLGLVLKGSSGENVQLANGKPATLTIPIAASQSSIAPTTIQLWYFDETTSMWIQEGEAQRIGNNYVGKVSHFTWWNCSFAVDSGTVKGKVIDCNGAAIPNIVVSFNGGFSLITNQYGEYQSWFPAGWGSTMVQVLSINNNELLLNSQAENMPSLNYGQVYTVPDLVVACPSSISGNITTCEGMLTDGLVNLTWGSGGYNFQYTTDGNFNILCPANTLVNFSAMSFYNSDFFTTDHVYTTLSNGNTLDIGNITLCNNIAADNWIRITGCFLMNDTLIYINPPFTNSAADVGNGYILSTFRYNNGNNGYSFSIHGGDVPGTYSLDDWSTNTVGWGKLNPADPNDWLSFESYTGTINVSYGNVGDYMIATYSGTGIMRKPGVNAPANVEGKLMIARQH